MRICCLLGLTLALLACDGGFKTESVVPKLAEKPSDGSHVVQSLNGALYFDGRMLPVGEPIERWIEFWESPTQGRAGW